MQRIISYSLLVALIYFIFVPQTQAMHRNEVLGTTTADLSIPPTTEGPGFILPDSRFFFLDQLKQDFRLFFAFSPEAKAKVHAAIAGERLAELRFMLAKKSTTGINIALSGIADNLQKASQDLETARLHGKNVTALAQQINAEIKDKQDVLNGLAKQARGELEARVKVAETALKEAKITAEDSLPDHVLKQEIKQDMKREVENAVQDATRSATELDRSINVLTKLASEAAEKQQAKRQEALKHAIEQKNEQLQRRLKITQEQEIKKEQKAAEISKKEIEIARETVKKAQEAAEKYRKIQEESDKNASDQTGR